MRPFQIVSIIACLLMLACASAQALLHWSWWWSILVLFVWINTLVLGAIKIRWNFFMVSLNKGKHDKYIALTFDDGPADETAAILDTLKEQQVAAAFFSIGKNAAAHPHLVKRWYDDGHLVGNHSYNHGFNFDWQSVRIMEHELQLTNELINSITGHMPKLFRPPYGVTNPNLARAVKRQGMTSIGWNLRSFDTTAKNKEQLLRRILDKLKGGDIILLHDSMSITREILTELITEARKKGFTFVRVDQLLDIEAYA